MAKYFELIAEIMSGVTKLLVLLLIINGNMTKKSKSTSTMLITANITDSNETNMTTAAFSYSPTDSTTFLSSTPTKTRKVIDKDYEHYVNIIKPIVYQVSFYVVVISVAAGLVLNPLVALVFGKSGMGRTPVGKETIFYFLNVCLYGFSLHYYLSWVVPPPDIRPID